MDWKLFWIFVIIGLGIYVAWMFYTQREIAYLSLLLYRENDADTYLKELDRWQVKLLFNKKLRKLMEIDARLAKNDREKLKVLFEEVNSLKLAPGDFLLVLQKEIPFYLEEKDIDKVKWIYQTMNKIYLDIPEKKKEKYTPIITETEYVYTIHVLKDGKFADELYRKAKSLKDEIPSGVYYYKASQSYYLNDDMKKCKEALGQAETRLRKTAYGKMIKEMLASGDYSDILSIRI